LIAITALWLEQKGQMLKSNLIQVSQIADCGVSGTHSYRTNFDIQFCLQNNSPNAILKRIGVDFSALRCVKGNCEGLQTVNKELPVNLAPGARQTFVENFSFSNVEPSAENVVWTATLVSVLAAKK